MNYLETLKNISKGKKKEGLIYLLVMCVVLLIAVSYIFGGKEKAEEKEPTVKVNSTVDNSVLSYDEMEKKLANILSEIQGISDVSVMVTYEYGTITTPVFNVSENEKEGSKSLEKEVVYNQEGTDKKIVIESVKMPKVEGVIVVAKGASSIEVKSKIASAVSAITSVGSYKVQVFEKKGE